MATLCTSCAHVRATTGKLGQTYLLCRNDAIPMKYPPQPVRGCPGYTPATAGHGDPQPGPTPAG